MLLAIDIGNTNIVIGCIKNEEILFVERLSTDSTKTVLEYAISFKNVLEIYHLNPSEIEGSIISSVVPPVTNMIKDAVKKITDKNIKSFERYARKYGINYALKKDKSKEPPVYLVFFKGRDQDALNAAFREFSQKQIQKANKPSIHKRLAAYRAMMPKKSKDKVKNRHQEQSR